MDTCYQGSVSGASLTTYKVYLMNVVLMGILVIIVVISIYWLACRTNKQQRRVQVGRFAFVLLYTFLKQNLKINFHIY